MFRPPQICHAGFCDLVESGSIDLASNATKVLEVVGETLLFVSNGESLASEETCSRLAEILVHMQQQMPSNLMNNAFSNISAEAQNGINAALQ